MSELAWNAWKELTVEEKEWRAKQFTDGPKADLVQYENGFLVRRRLINHMRILRNFFMMSHPKTGTTWTQELVWMMDDQQGVPP